MLDGLKLSLSTLTVLPVRSGNTDRRTAGRAMELAPLVGLGLGLVAAAFLYAARITLDSPFLPPVLAIGLLALMTRGLHLDGLADLADGLGSFGDPERARAVMKDPAVGAFGVLWLVFIPLVQVLALLGCVEQGRGTASLVLAVVTGRLAITAACRSTPAATDEGLGAMVAGTVRRGVTEVWFLVLAGGFAAYALADTDTTGGDAARLGRTVLGLVAGLLIARLVRRHAVKRVGGLTGDVLGALCELATTVCLVVLAFRGEG